MRKTIKVTEETKKELQELSEKLGIPYPEDLPEEIEVEMF